MNWAPISTILALICGFLATSVQLQSQQSAIGTFTDWHIQSVAFSVARISVLNDARSDIFLINPPQKKPVRLVEGVAPQWCPNGSKIAFVGFHGRDAGPEIFTINPDGSGRTQVTNKKGGTGAVMPSWSVDGKRIAFVVSRQDIHDPEIFVMDEDGTKQQFVTIGVDPHWSPDGRKLVFSRSVKGDPSRSSVWVVNLDGSGATAITDETSNSLFPQWTRDGKIVFASNRNGRFAIYRMNPDGTSREGLLYSKDSDYIWPIVSPDGKRLIVVATKFIDSQTASGIVAPGAEMRIMGFDLSNPRRAITLSEGAHPSVLWASQ